MINVSFGKKLFYRKNAELLSLWWIFVLALVAGGIVIAVTLYYSASININEIHSDILAERIIRCLSEDGYLKNPELIDFYGECKLKKEVFDEGELFFKVEVYDGDLILSTGRGNLAFEEDCKIQEKIDSKYFPKCSERKEIVLYENRTVVLKVLAGYNQEGALISLTGGDNE